MVESILRRFIEHPSRRWIVIITTLLMGLVVVWPLADEYFAQQNQLEGLESTLAAAQTSVASRDVYQQRLQERLAELELLEKRTLPEARMFEFRGEIAEIARNTGCQVRQMRMGKAGLRAWREKDNPLEATSTGKTTPFELRTQQFSLSVLGSLTAVKSFLSQLEQANKLMHAQALAIRPEAADPRNVELDLQLMLFDLQLAVQPAKK